MTAALNILLGCLLLMTQAVGAFTPHVTEEESASCRCCACGAEGCAVPQPAPTPAPTPLAIQRISAETETARPQAGDSFSALAPSLSPDVRSILCPSVIRVAAPPLYRQHCALLI
jgi:hypothetical protein